MGGSDVVGIAHASATPEALRRRVAVEEDVGQRRAPRQHVEPPAVSVAVVAAEGDVAQRRGPAGRCTSRRRRHPAVFPVTVRSSASGSLACCTRRAVALSDPGVADGVAAADREAVEDGGVVDPAVGAHHVVDVVGGVGEGGASLPLRSPLRTVTLAAGSRCSKRGLGPGEAAVDRDPALEQEGGRRVPAERRRVGAGGDPDLGASAGRGQRERRPGGR